MKQFLQRILWRWLARDCLVLRPGWAVLSRTGDHLIVGAKPDGDMLAVAYNQRTDHDWKLHYRLRSVGSGLLHYTLAAPGKDPFCELTRPCHLPCDWTLELCNGGLLLNGQPAPLLPGRTLPVDTPWLNAQLTFTPQQGPKLTRQTGHRVRSHASHDADYFTGAVYEDYDHEASPVCKAPLECLRQFGPLQGRLLDAGCATGLLVQEALARGLEAEGIDVSPWAVDQANLRTHSRCCLLNLDQASTTDFPRPYQLIVCQSVLEHLADPSRALQLLYDILAPGGMIYLQTLNADSLSHALFDSDWSGFSDPTHQSPWITSDWLHKTTVDIGFEVLHFRRYGFWNENRTDPAWRAFQSLLQLQPACTVLEDNYGDFVETVLRK